MFTLKCSVHSLKNCVLPVLKSFRWHVKWRARPRPMIGLRTLTGSRKIEAERDIEKVRNIGIIAHIDAGKTTTTERMLYYAGVSRVMGEVHDGDTVMDYMPQERQRGITITSAAITFAWADHRVNLIDTPGHVDFTVEVERALLVMDGAVAILDASAGVEAQTLTVWRQANRYRVPRIIYLNKMDKASADMKACIMSIEKKFGTKPLVLQMPLVREKTFEGFVDLVSMEAIVWTNQGIKSDGTEYHCQKLDPTRHGGLWDVANKMREDLIEQVSDFDNDLAELVICSDSPYHVSVSDLKKAIRRVTLKQTAVPVFCGSSYKNAGVQPLLDGVLDYLPNPLDTVHDFVQFYEPDLCCLAFKIIHHKQRGALTFFRIYSGSMIPGQKLYNVNRDSLEKVGKLLLAFADDFEEVQEVTNGNIVVVSGMTTVVTGDTCVSSKMAAENARKRFALKSYSEHDDVKLVLASIVVPDPVFFCSIEAPSLSFQGQLDLALEQLQREDPTIRVRTDPDSGQTVLSGMGELHIDVVKDRILKEYSIEAFLGPLQVSYREAISSSAEETFVISKTLGGHKHYVKITLGAKPEVGLGALKKLQISSTKENDLGKLRPDHLRQIEHGLYLALAHGPILGFPVIDARLRLLWFEAGRGTSPAMISSAASQCLSSLLKKAEACLLEPVMSLEIVTDEDRLSRVLTDLSRRRSEILELQSRQNARVVLARTPLADLRNYSSQLRTLTSGMASFTIEFDSYQYMSIRDQQLAIKDVTGFAPV